MKSLPIFLLSVFLLSACATSKPSNVESNLRLPSNVGEYLVVYENQYFYFPNVNDKESVKQRMITSCQNDYQGKIIPGGIKDVTWNPNIVGFAGICAYGQITEQLPYRLTLVSEKESFLAPTEKDSDAVKQRLIETCKRDYNGELLPGGTRDISGKSGYAYVFGYAGICVHN